MRWAACLLKRLVFVSTVGGKSVIQQVSKHALHFKMVSSVQPTYRIIHQSLTFSCSSRCQCVFAFLIELLRVRCYGTWIRSNYPWVCVLVSLSEWVIFLWRAIHAPQVWMASFGLDAQTVVRLLWVICSNPSNSCCSAFHRCIYTQMLQDLNIKQLNLETTIQVNRPKCAPYCC